MFRIVRIEYWKYTDDLEWDYYFDFEGGKPNFTDYEHEAQIFESREKAEAELERIKTYCKKQERFWTILMWEIEEVRAA